MRHWAKAMQTPGREPSMEDILASIKKVIAEEKELRAALPDSALAAAEAARGDEDEDVLELDQRLAVPVEPLLDEQAAGHSRQALEQLQSVAASAPPIGNPLEDMVREMLRPMLKQWLDEHLPAMIDEHVKREIARITGKPL
jgi:cell pole-organizing protein PopZ